MAAPLSAPQSVPTPTVNINPPSADAPANGNPHPNDFNGVPAETLPSFPSGVTQTPCGDVVGSVTVVGSQTVTIGKTVFGQGTNNVVACTAPTGRGGR